VSRCLVTGHKGYIGSKLLAKLEELGHEVMGIDLNEDIPHDIIKDLREGTDGKFHPHYFNFQPEYIFHMACWPRVGYSVEHPVETNENNILAGTILLNFARKVGSVKRVIYSSSSSVMGNGDGPESPYALQKYTTEIETTLYSRLYGLDTVSLRYFNVYSHDQSVSGPYATAISNWMHALRNDIQPYISGDGEQRRDMINVEDVVSANIFCMQHQESFGGEVYEIGTGTNISLNQIKEIVNKHFPSVEFQYTDPRPGDIDETKALTEPLREKGWTASIDIDTGIEDCFERVKNEYK
jgi:UDP-glucose 4-epimerase